VTFLAEGFLGDRGDPRRFSISRDSGILEAPKKVLSEGEAHMINIMTDIQSLTNFRRSSAELIKHLRKSKRPMVLTVKGKAAAVVQDAEAYQRLLDIAARADAPEGIRQGLEDARKGKARPARQFFSEFEAIHGISR
jgi:PHD/YefM family antitoxin component YafN of YafNO toxin-antitoxin module